MSHLARLLVEWLLQQFAGPAARWRSLAGEASDDLRDRRDLFAIEARADLARVLRIVLVGLLGFLAAFASLIWLSAAAILLAWDGGYRDVAIIIVAGGWVCLAAFCVGWLRVTLARGPRPLTRSRQLLDEDLAALREAMGGVRR